MKLVTACLNDSARALLAAVAGGQDAEAQGCEITEDKVRQAWTDLIAWDRWLDAHRRNLPEEERQLHELTIRWAKGLVKSWRVTLAEQRSTKHFS